MSNAEAAMSVIVIMGTIAVVRYWFDRVRRVPLEYYGMDSVKHVLKWESEGRRRQILKRGWMTRHEWTSMNIRQAEMFDAEVKRRGTDPDSKK